ncbi:unknown [Candidatus Colimorpha enterica]|uniref:Uncharacterized protein n=1 Tax=Candidatus Colimorpha enterica TaxID=3083063 RepID=R6U2P4_9BACT|nr:unknown [Candidatus Colimorpha enterica]
MVAFLRAALSSATDSSSPSQYFSKSASSVSAIASTIWAWYSSAFSRISSGMGSTLMSLPISS